MNFIHLDGDIKNLEYAMQWSIYIYNNDFDYILLDPELFDHRHIIEKSLTKKPLLYIPYKWNNSPCLNDPVDRKEQVWLYVDYA